MIKTIGQDAISVKAFGRDVTRVMAFGEKVWEQELSPLPVGYERLEYVRINGSGDAKIYPFKYNSSDLIIEYKIRYINPVPWDTQLLRNIESQTNPSAGSWSTLGKISSYYYRYPSKGSLLVYFNDENNTQSSIRITPVPDDKDDIIGQTDIIKIDIEANRQRAWLNGVLKGTMTRTMPDTDLWYCLFFGTRMHPADDSEYTQSLANLTFAGDVYEVKMSSHTEILNHFIPAKRLSDGQAGFYDDIGNAFYVGFNPSSMEAPLNDD